MDKGTKDVAATRTVTRQYKKTFPGGEKVESPQQVLADEKLVVHQYVTAPATVGVSLGQTINLGNFESVRIDVSVTVPCYREEIEDAYVWAKDFAEERMKAESADVNAIKKSSPF